MIILSWIQQNSGIGTKVTGYRTDIVCGDISRFCWTKIIGVTKLVNRNIWWLVHIRIFFVICCLSLGLFNKTGKIKLKKNEHSEFTTLSWLSMIFGAGIGIGMLTYSTAEPIFHFANNPDTIKDVSDIK